MSSLGAPPNSARAKHELVTHNTPIDAANTLATKGDPQIRRDAEIDGGTLCWLQVLGTFAVWANTWGLVSAFGEFQAYYLGMLPQSPSQIAWIGSIQAFFLLATGIVTGALSDAGWFRTLIICGNLLIVLGTMLTSICSRYWQLILSQGIMTGIGFGCVFIPGVSVLPQYFVKKRQLANGIAAAGSGFGGVIYPIVLRLVSPYVGFHWAVRIVGFIMLCFGLVAVFTLRFRRPPASPQQSRILGDFFQDTPLLLCTAGMFFILMSLYIPVVFITSYGLARDITNSNLAFYLVSITQAANIAGRLVPSLLADRTGPLNMVIPTIFGTSIMAFAWIAVHDKAGLVVFAIVYGALFGTILALVAPCVASLTADKSRLGARMGLSFGIASFGVLAGTPVAGATLGASDSFVHLQVFTGGVSAAAGCMYLAGRVCKDGIKWVKI